MEEGLRRRPQRRFRQAEEAYKQEVAGSSVRLLVEAVQKWEAWSPMSLPGVEFDGYTMRQSPFAIHKT